jgi:hypothetical protein
MKFAYCSVSFSVNISIYDSKHYIHVHFDSKLLSQFPWPIIFKPERKK